MSAPSRMGRKRRLAGACLMQHRQWQRHNTPHRSRQYAHPAHDLLEPLAVRRPQPLGRAMARLDENRLFLAERAKAPFPVISAHAACPHAAKRLCVLRQVEQAVVDAVYWELVQGDECSDYYPSQQDYIWCFFTTSKRLLR